MSTAARSHPGSPLIRMLTRLNLGRPRGAVTIAVLLVLIAPPLYLLQTGGALTTGYTIQKLQNDRTTWLQRNQQLHVEIARARSLAYVEHEAVERLGMQHPGQQTIVRMDITPPSVTVRPTPRPASTPRRQPSPAAPPSRSPLDALGSLLFTLVMGQ
ncbi:MAG: hypothetical protein IT305_04970 [Chloroflexi bacterium]|nr:hypothetical protein [Chloroflexota bacterium]